MTDILPDPFGELGPVRHRKTVSALGARIDIESNHAGLLGLAADAFAGLPVHRLGAPLHLRLVLKCCGGGPDRRWRNPPLPRLASGGGILTSSFDAANFAVVAPDSRLAFVNVSPQALRFEYHVRYELIEFAVITLAARARRLVPLHAACVGRRGRGLLLLGGSGAGKSTMCLAAALAGIELLSEDSVFVTPDRMLAAGLPNYLHVRRDGLRFVDDRPTRSALKAAPTIRRRSGVRKLELDLREGALPVSRRALRIAAVVVLSARRRKSGALLRRLRRADVLSSLRGSQAYARQQPGWGRFERKVGQLPGYVLFRGSHPREGASELRAVLDSAR
jgi:hypothetical protein